MFVAVLLKICLEVLLALSCGLGEIFRISPTSPIVYRHGLDVIHPCHFVAVSISCIEVL